MDKIKAFLTQANNLPSCVRWNNWKDNEKEVFLTSFNFDNLMQINYQTNELDGIKRNF
ncbi:MAG: hypothetical protein ACOX50_04860 [Patescibacteria group bacterium]